MRISRIPVSVLRPVNSGNNFIVPVSTTASSQPRESISCERVLNKACLIHIRKQLEALSTAFPQDFHTVVCAYLADSSGADRALLDKWAGFGRLDRGRSVQLGLSAEAHRTVSPLGVACLISYARAWLDESEARELGAIQPVAVRRRSSDSAPKCRPVATSQSLPARAGGGSSRRRSP